MVSQCLPTADVPIQGQENDVYEHPTKRCPDYTEGKVVYRCRSGQWNQITDRCKQLEPKDLSYASTYFELLINQPMVSVTPSVKGYQCMFLIKNPAGEITPPALPAGISLSSANGTISGTPTELKEKFTYTIIARNDVGDAEAVISIVVVSQGLSTADIPVQGQEDDFYEHPTEKCPDYTEGKVVYRCRSGQWNQITDRCKQLEPKDLSYASTYFELLINQPMVSVTPSVKGYQCMFLIKNPAGEITPPALPAGISLSSANGTISGTPTELKEKFTYTIIARNEVGDAEAVISILVTSEKGNTVMWVIIIVLAVLILAVIGLYLFRSRGTGRNTHKARALKATAASKTNRV